MKWTITLTALALVGCGAPSQDESASNSANPENVTKESFEAEGLLWPLTGDRARLGCDQMARWVEVDGTRYGLNGMASEERGYASLENVWAVDEKMMADLAEAGATDGPVMRVNIGDMSSQAAAFCE